MAWQTPKTNWGQPGQTVPIADDFNRIEGNIQHLQDTKETPAGAQAKAEAAAGAVQAELNMHKADNAAHVPHLGTTTNSGNNYSITSTKVINDGAKFSVKFNVAATGAATLKISSDGTARALKKPGGGDFKPKAGIYTLIRDGANFQLLGEGGEYGTATASDVLSGKTIGTENGLVTGTMPNRGAVNQNLTSHNQEYTIPSGYHNGLGKIKAVISGLTANVIKAGTTVGGVLGTFTSDANAVAGDILSGKTAYKNGAKLTGTMTNRGAVTNTITTQGGSYTIPAGYHNGSGKVTASFSNLKASNVKKGVNIGGVVGNYVGDVIQAGDNTILSSSTERVIESTTMKKGKEIRMLRSGTFRFKINFRYSAGHTYTVQFYKNGTPFGTGVSTGNSLTADIPVVSGDLVQVYAKGSGRVYLEDFYVRVETVAEFTIS